jgi:hypothetical protein
VRALVDAKRVTPEEAKPYLPRATDNGTIANGPVNGTGAGIRLAAA